MIVNGKLSVECTECGKIHDIYADGKDFEITERIDKPMGQQRGHTWEHDFECDGNNQPCGNPIEIECVAWEYPSNTYEDDNLTLEGANEVERFTYDFSDQPEPDYNE